MPEPTWYTRKQAADYLTRHGCPISPRTLENLASNNNAGRGPAFTRFRWRNVRYHKDDLDLWISREAVRVA